MIIGSIDKKLSDEKNHKFLFCDSVLSKDEELRDKCLNLCIEKHKKEMKEFPFSFREIDENKIELRRHKSSNCIICNRIHEKQNPYIFITPNIETRILSIRFDCRRRENGERTLFLGFFPMTSEQINRLMPASEEKKCPINNIMNISYDQNSLHQSIIDEKKVTQGILHNFTDTSLKKIIKKLPGYGVTYKLGTVNKNIINLIRLIPSFCHNCNCVHNTENPCITYDGCTHQIRMHCKSDHPGFEIGKIKGLFFSDTTLIEQFDWMKAQDIVNQDSFLWQQNLIRYVNRTLACVSGTKMIIVEKIIKEGKVIYVKRTKSEAKNIFCNRKIYVTETKDSVTKLTLKNIFDIWVNSPYRLDYFDVGIDPSPNITDETLLNTYTPPQFNSDEYISNLGEMNKVMHPLLWHIFEIWWKKNEKLYKLIILWFAHILQKPWIKSKIAPVLISEKEGAGKNIVIDKIRKIFGRHGKLVSNDNMVIGEFNETALGETLFLHLDEAFWGGDKKSVGKVKDLIAGDEGFMNQKGLAAYVVTSYLNIMMASNNIRAIPAENGARRYCVFELDERYAGMTTPEITEYFNKISVIPNSVVYQYYMTLKIPEGFRPNEAVMTDGLRKSKDTQHGCI